MASRIVTGLLISAAIPIARTIRRGEPLPTVMGALAGALLGASSYFVVFKELVPFLTLVGAIAGANITARICKRPAVRPGERATDLEPFRLGKVVRAWPFAAGDFQSLAVLLENALYLVREDNAPWDEVIRKLSNGEYPEIDGSDLIRLDELLRIELKSPEALEITLVYGTAGRARRRHVDVQTTASRDELIAALELQTGNTFTRRQCAVATARAIQTPAILAAVGTILFSLIAWLAVHWRANPPGPPRGKSEQDPLVRLLIWAGPEGVLLVGGVLVLAALTWLTIRVLRPPQIEVLQIQDELIPARNE